MLLRHPIQRPISVQSEPCHSRPAGGWSVLIPESERREAHVADCTASPAGHSAGMIRSRRSLSPPSASCSSEPSATRAGPAGRRIAARSAGYRLTTRSDMAAAGGVSRPIPVAASRDVIGHRPLMRGVSAALCRPQSDGSAFRRAPSQPDTRIRPATDLLRFQDPAVAICDKRRPSFH